MQSLSLSEARRIALAAQGFHRPRPARVRAADVEAVIRRLGLLQIDFVNVLTPAHYQVPFSRLGVYDRALLDTVVYGSGKFTEQWAREASIVPMDTWPLLRHRRESHRVRPWGFEKFLAENRDYSESVLAQVRSRGPLAADEVPDPAGVSSRLEGSWYGSVRRAVLEAFFGSGVLGVVSRRPDFARVYDLAERLIPAEFHERAVGREEAQREIVHRAAKACGVGVAADLADYYRMPVRDARSRLTELVESGALQQVRVDGWREPAYLAKDAVLPPAVHCAALLSPFDPVVWFRPRAMRLFSFEYRFEIFVPAEARRWGCYVLPFLMGERLVARVDLKADRAKGRLQVLSAGAEPGEDVAVVAEALAAELAKMARWLGLDTVAVGRRGGLASALRKAGA